MDSVYAIEKVRTDRDDRPFDEIKIINITVKWIYLYFTDSSSHPSIRFRSLFLLPLQKRITLSSHYPPSRAAAFYLSSSPSLSLLHSPVIGVPLTSLRFVNQVGAHQCCKNCRGPSHFDGQVRRPRSEHFYFPLLEILKRDTMWDLLPLQSARQKNALSE